MAHTPDDFIENEEQDQQHLAETRQRGLLNTYPAIHTKERLASATNKLLQQQQRLRKQHQSLLALQQRLERQYNKLFESFPLAGH